jgi:hypothetical protein
VADAAHSKRSHDFWVSIHGERGEEWKRIADTNHFPVKSPIPSLGILPGKGEQRVYLLALDQMLPHVLDRIVAHLAAKFGMTPEETKEEMEKAGIPILADECSVMVHNPMRWF